MKAGDFGVTIFYGRKPIKKPCANCPFTAAAAGDDYLAPGRLDSIKFSVSMGQPFHCHKTVHHPKVRTVVDENGNEDHPSYDKNYRVCAGAWQFAEALADELGIEPARIGARP